MQTIDSAGPNWRYGLLAALLISGCGGGSGSAGNTPGPQPGPIEYEYQPPEDIGDGWNIANAADVGIDTEALEEMMRDIAAGDFDYIDSVAVARSGSLAFVETIRTTTDSEDGRVGNTDPSMHRQYSVSKSITSLLVGIAIEDGYIAGVDVPFLDLFTYSSYANQDPRKGDITLEHVLAMQAGFEWNEWDPPYTSPDNRLNQFIERETDYAKALLDLPLAADPGEAFAYNTIATAALGQAVENSVPMAVIDYGLNALFLPLGITEIEVLTTPTGLPDGGSGFYLKTRDAAKFAQVLLDGGQFNGERIVSEQWIVESVTPRTEIGWDDPENRAWQVAGYGYQWWTGFYEFGGREIETWVAWGFGGQLVIAIPELELAVAINAHGYDDEDEALDQGHTLVRDHLLPATAE